MADDTKPPGMIGESPSARGLSPIPIDPAEHAARFAREWQDLVETYVQKRMKELGLPEGRIGAIELAQGGVRRAFDPEGQAGGSCDEYGRLYLDSGILNPELLAKMGEEAAQKWRRMSVRNRIDAIIPHEDIESRTASHEEALKAGPDTELPISPEAREMLQAMKRGAGR
jgi:hypothetical protein